MTIRLALAIMASFAATPLHGQPTAAAQSEHAALSLELAKELNGEALLRVQIDNVMDKSLPGALAKDPALSQLEASMPGISNEFIKVMKPIIIDDIMMRLPDFHRQAATIFAGDLTTADLRNLLTFYRSSDGRAVIAAMGRNANFDAMLSEQIASGGEKQITAKDIQGVTQSAALTTLRGLTKEQQLAVFRFGLSPSGRKLGAINQKITVLAAKWSNELSPATEKKIEKAVTDLVEERFAGTERKK